LEDILEKALELYKRTVKGGKRFKELQRWHVLVGAESRQRKNGSAIAKLAFNDLEGVVLSEDKPVNELHLGSSSSSGQHPGLCAPVMIQCACPIILNRSS